METGTEHVAKARSKCVPSGIFHKVQHSCQVSIALLHYWHFTFIEIYSVCLVLKHASPEYATNAFSSNEKYEKIAVVVHVLQTTQNLDISRCCFAEDGKEMYQEL